MAVANSIFISSHIILEKVYMLYCPFPSLCPPQLIPFSDQLSFSLHHSPECDNHHYWRGGGVRGGAGESKCPLPPRGGLSAQECQHYRRTNLSEPKG